MFGRCVAESEGRKMKTRWYMMVCSLLCVSTAAWGMRASNVTSVAVDTRDYAVVVRSAYGTPVPAAGTNLYAWRATVTGGVASYEMEGARTNHVCLGWFGTGSASDGSGATLPPICLTHTETSIIWQWRDEYLVYGASGGGGGVVPESAWVAAGGDHVVTAVSDQGWLLTGWSGDFSGDASQTNLTFTVTRAVDVVAAFSDDPDGDGLKNVDEWAVGADPWNSDTDGDKFGDKIEVDRGWDPCVSDAWAVDHILANKTVFGHYTTEEIGGLAGDGLMITVENNVVRLRMQMLSSSDLTTWTNAGDQVEWLMPADAGKAFYRVRSSK